MRTIQNILFICFLAICFCSCEKEWEEELYKNVVSFGKNGVADIYLRYKPNGITSYQVPVILSGTTMNEHDLQVNVALDKDTLEQLNFERFRYRDDLYFKELDAKYYSLPTEPVHIEKGNSVGLLNIDFTLGDLDMVEKYILPLSIVEGNGYDVNYRKHYRRALLNVIPFNDYSGSYAATAGLVYQRDKAENDQVPISMETRTLKVVDDNSCFFYAGVTDEELKDRELYKIIANFEEEGQMTLEAPHADEIGFKFISADYVITEEMDPLQPYLKHRYIKIQMEYEYNELIPNTDLFIPYVFRGSITMERKINTTIPDEDQAIIW